MHRHTIYISDELELEIQAVARKEGWRISDVIRRRLELASSNLQYQQKVIRLEKKIDAIYALLHLQAGDFGYMSGSTRISTKSIEHIKKEGTNRESYMRRVASELKAIFEQSEPFTIIDRIPLSEENKTGRNEPV